MLAIRLVQSQHKFELGCQLASPAQWFAWSVWSHQAAECEPPAQLLGAWL